MALGCRRTVSSQCWTECGRALPKGTVLTSGRLGRVHLRGPLASAKPQGRDVLLRSHDHSSEGYSQVGQRVVGTVSLSSETPPEALEALARLNIIIRGRVRLSGSKNETVSRPPPQTSSWP
ncbi:unnamed protein product [Pleuronectes platessa]|uniref:Uncharacterized protein n=1 Tax=Pleuronectes platessa TaxID=8262 RepID=A0A9N7TZR2_PLEPL|nr:unnamed protein product [Pleuronectes platessa]